MRLLHTSITVRNLEESLRFYTEVLGLEFERRHPIPENRAEIAFVRDPASGGRVELTYWQDKTGYEAGDQLDHLAFDVPDLDAFLTRAKAQGVRVAKEPYQLRGGSGRLAFLLDPNDIWIELIETRSDRS
ncbi:MAG: VOC family protein [Thermoplasmata archaeon]|nr:VOC family protein [Thermoplasmata archaeon]MCI4341062.1 VOC family protein [Thermoplasmata archaeon]